MSESYRVTILGCGASSGLPMIGDKWGDCDPNNPKNRRTRCAAFITDDVTSLLIDPGPDLRQQCLDNNIQGADAILCTHMHADHTHGIDDIRGLNRIIQKPIDFYADAVSMADLNQRFGYAFKPLPEGHGFYRPVLTPHILEDGDIFQVGRFKIQAISVDHGFSKCLSFRIGNFAYTTDVKHLSDTAMDALQGIETWIVDCQALSEQYTHSHLAQTLSWIAEIKPKRAVLTHMGPQLDYQKTKDLCPAHVEPGYDGMKLEIKFH